MIFLFTDSIADGLACDVSRKLLFFTDAGFQEIAYVDYSNVDKPSVPKTLDKLKNSAVLRLENPRDIELDELHK